MIESIPVHEDIKLGKPDRDRYIGELLRKYQEGGKSRREMYLL